MGTTFQMISPNIGGMPRTSKNSNSKYYSQDQQQLMMIKPKPQTFRTDLNSPQNNSAALRESKDSHFQQVMMAQQNNNSRGQVNSF